MFSDEELEVIEEIVTRFSPDWVETRLDQGRVDSILEKIDTHLNG